MADESTNPISRKSTSPKAKGSTPKSKEPTPKLTESAPSSNESTPRVRQASFKEEDWSAESSIEGESYDDTEEAELTLTVDSPDLAAELEKEKARYTGAGTWAKDEEQLFEILFLRSERPLMPPHWDVDFRGVPMMDTVFHGDAPVDPVIYSHSKEFQATMALMRLIDLTAEVRTSCQSGLRRKAPVRIKQALDKFIMWAAEDGGYLGLKTVPNIITAVVDSGWGEEEMTAFMEARMRALAAAQRDFLRFDEDANFWSLQAQEKAHQDAERVDLLVEKYVEKERNSAHVKQEDAPDTKKFEPPEMGYRHKPPVLYGLFILRTSVFLLTVDSAKGPEAYVSFHVDLDFNDQHQSVWNALTVAIAVCLARDKLMERLEEFDALSTVSESDPDA